MEKIKVLLAEDEETLAIIIKESLETRHFEVTIADNGKAALEFYKSDCHDLLVLDIMMPEKDGFAVAKEIRKGNKYFPIIMLTAKSQISDIIHGFKQGANDYLKKPFSMEELIVRIEAVLGRQRQYPMDQKIDIGEYRFDIQRQTLSYEDEQQELTYMETKLLSLLVENKNVIVNRSLILNEIWGSDNFFNGRSMDVFITRLRKKLSKDPTVRIINIRGRGYKIVFNALL